MRPRLFSLVLYILAIALRMDGRNFELPQSPQSALEQTLISAEKNLLDAFQRGDITYIRNAVDSDFYAIATNGDGYGKADLLEGIPPYGGQNSTKPILYFFQVVPLTDGAAVVTYEVVVHGKRPDF